MEKTQRWGKGASTSISSPVDLFDGALALCGSTTANALPFLSFKCKFLYVFFMVFFCLFVWFNSFPVQLAYAECFAYFYDLWLFNSFYVFNNSLLFFVVVVLGKHRGNRIIYHFALVLGPGCGRGRFHSQSCTAYICQKRLKLHQLKLLHSYKSTLNKISLKSWALWIY